MADPTLKRLADLIRKESPATLRRAALVVAGALGDGRDATLGKAVRAALADAEFDVRLAAIEAVGELRMESALPELVEFVKSGGPELEAAARSAGRLGAKGARAMEKLMADARPAHRQRIAAALAEGGTASAETAAAHALLDADSGVVDAAARSLAAELPQMSPSHRKALADQLIAELKGGRKEKLPAASEAAMVRVLAAIKDQRAEPLFWGRIDRARPNVIRAAALQALGGFGTPKTADRIERLLDCAADPDFQVAAPAMFLLREAAVDTRRIRSWLRLLEASDPAARRFGMEKLRGIESAEAARALVEQLKHPLRELRDLAAETLATTRSGRSALVSALLAAETVDEAWTLARAQSAFARQTPAALRSRLFAAACKLRDADDRRAEPLFFLLREMDPQWTHDQILGRALALRQKKNYAAAVEYLKLLVRDPACGPEARFELAAAGLKISAKDLSPEARQADPALAQFSRLLHEPGFDLFRRLSKLHWLDADDLFYLGFHFAERNQREKEFGGQVLELLVRRSPRSPRAKDARRKLRSEGLA